MKDILIALAIFVLLIAAAALPIWGPYFVDDDDDDWDMR